MSSIKFGIRTCRLKVYSCNYFKITDQEIDAFSLQYENLDVWNTYKKVKVDKPQIEKRIRYFHILFIPLFSLEVEWTTRRRDGLLYITNETCLKKIKSTLKRIRSPWYFNILPILALLSLLMLFIVIIFFYFRISEYHIIKKEKSASLMGLNQFIFSKKTRGLLFS